jgi:hypothetical protein
MSKYFSNRVKYEAALIVNKFSIKNSISTSVLKQICKLMQKPSTVDVRTQEELLACLKNAFARSDLSLDDVVVLKEILKMMDDYLSSLYPKTVSTSVNLICDIVACIDKNHSHFLDSLKLIYSILMKLSLFQDTVIVLASLKLIKTVFHTFDTLTYGHSFSDFYSSVVEKGILNLLYRLLIHYENDTDSQEIILDVLCCITLGDVYACKSIVGFGFLPIFLHMLQNTKYMLFKYQNVYHKLCAIIKNILIESALHRVMIDCGIVSHMIRLVLDKKPIRMVPAFIRSFFPFSKNNFETFNRDRDLKYFQQRVHLILEGIDGYDDSFFEQTIFSMINFKAF